MIEWVVSSDEDGMRLDVYLAQQSGESRSQIRRWIQSGDVLVNGQKPAKAGVRVQPGDRVGVATPSSRADSCDVQAEPLPLDIVYEDEAIIVVNKPKGMVVHPAPGHAGGTLVNALLHHEPALRRVGTQPRPGIVHRLDKDTSGLMVVAKTELAYETLISDLKNRRVERTYIALVHGRPPESDGMIVTRIGRHPVHRQRMAVVDSGGKEAITHFYCIEQRDAYSLLRVRLETGRTHQIRVHLAHIGLPVVGDTVYGPKHAKFLADGQALHAFQLGLYHPITKEWLHWQAPLPVGFASVLQRLGFSNP